MQIMRVIIVTIVSGWFLRFLGKTVMQGLRTGEIRHTDSTSTCRRDQNPFEFWGLVVFFKMIVEGFAIVWLVVLMDAVK